MIHIPGIPRDICTNQPPSASLPQLPRSEALSSRRSSQFIASLKASVAARCSASRVRHGWGSGGGYDGRIGSIWEKG